MKSEAFHVILMYMSDPQSPWTGRPDSKSGQTPSGDNRTPQHQHYQQSSPSFGSPIGSQNPYGSQYGPQQPYSGQTPPHGNAPYPNDKNPKQRNTVGIIGLVVAILGAIMSVVPGAAIIGWILLPIGFILGLVGLFMSGKPKGTAIAAVIVSIVGTILAMAFFVTVVGDAFDDAFNEDVTVSRADGEGASDAESADVGTPDAGSAIGSRENPAAIGDAVSGDQWEVVVNGFTRNATDQVMAANQFNDPPPVGSQYALVNLTATYIGEGSSLVDFIGVAFVTDSGNVIRSFDHAAVTPDPLEGELYSGASATGNVDLAIPEGATGLLRLELGTFGGEVFVAVE